MSILINGAGNDITLNGVSVTTDAESTASLAFKADVASPAFTGTPTAPTPTAGDNSTKIATTAYVMANGVPTGTVVPFAAAVAPTGWVKCNGALLSRTTYAALFAVIGTTFGVGDGSTTFALPDMRGYFSRGWDDGRGIDTGRTFGSIQADDFKSHGHTIYINTNKGYSTGGTTWDFLGTYGAGTSTGAAGGTETRPKNIALLYCIKY